MCVRLLRHRHVDTPLREPVSARQARERTLPGAAACLHASCSGGGPDTALPREAAGDGKRTKPRSAGSFSVTGCFSIGTVPRRSETPLQRTKRLNATHPQHSRTFEPTPAAVPAMFPAARIISPVTAPLSTAVPAARFSKPVTSPVGTSAPSARSVDPAVRAFEEALAAVATASPYDMYMARKYVSTPVKDFSTSIYGGVQPRRGRDSATMATVETTSAAYSWEKTREASARGTCNVGASTHGSTFKLSLNRETALRSCLRPAWKPRGPKKTLRFATPLCQYQRAPSV